MAVNEPEVEHHLILLGQKPGRENIIREGFARNSGIFKTFGVLYDTSGVVTNYVRKRKALRHVARFAERLAPTKVIVGNDRRVEFQYTMYSLRQAGASVVGVYIDDGTGSYLNGRYMTRWGGFTDRYFDRPIKKVLYGPWCERVQYLGGTQWVDECYLNFPELAPERIKQSKQVFALDSAWYKSDNFLVEIKQILNSQEENLNLKAISTQRFDALLILPSKKFVTAQFSSVEEYNAILNKYLAQFDSVAIKYHPREKDYYFQSDKNVTVLPSSLPAELLFSLIEVRHIVGDVSSAVLSAVWLFPDISTVCLCPQRMPYPPMMKLIERISVVVERI